MATPPIVLPIRSPHAGLQLQPVLHRIPQHGRILNTAAPLELVVGVDAPHVVQPAAAGILEPGIHQCGTGHLIAADGRTAGWSGEAVSTGLDRRHHLQIPAEVGAATERHRDGTVFAVDYDPGWQGKRPRHGRAHPGRTARRNSKGERDCDRGYSRTRGQRHARSEADRDGQPLVDREAGTAGLTAQRGDVRVAARRPDDRRPVLEKRAASRVGHLDHLSTAGRDLISVAAGRPPAPGHAHGIDHRHPARRAVSAAGTVSPWRYRPSLQPRAWPLEVNAELEIIFDLDEQDRFIGTPRVGSQSSRRARTTRGPRCW